MYTYHQLTSADVASFRSIMGTKDLSTDYNQQVDGKGTGLAPPSELDYEEMVGSYVLTSTSTADLTASAPSSFDLSTSGSFPAVGNQGSQGSCAAWALTYYVYGYMEAADNGWTSAKSGSTSQLLSPAWTYNRLNDYDKGSSIVSNGWVIEDWGVPTLATMPYLASDYTSWGNDNAMSEAPLHRASSVTYVSDYSTSTIKGLVQAGKPVAFALDGYQFGSALKDNPTAPKIITASEYTPNTPNHAQVIVGWDDSRTEDGETGAFRVVNSWGTGWGESGYYWITYSAFAEMASKYTPCYMEDRLDYAPTITATWHYDSVPGRDSTFTLKLQNNNTGATVASKTFYYRSSFSNGAVPKQPGYMVVDISDFASSYSATNSKFAIEFSGGSAQGTISSFRVERYEGGYSPGKATQISRQASGLPKTTSGAITTFMAPYAKLSYADALDSSGITFSSTGTATWVPEVHQSMSGGDALQSGDVADGRSSTLSATITGPATLQFDWKASSESADSFTYLLDGSVKGTISGSTGWAHVSLAIASGSHKVDWTYAKSTSISRYDDCGYLDKVYVGSGGGSSGDTTPPTSILSTSGTQGSAGWFISSVTVTLSATDSGGISSTSYRLNGGSWQTYGAPFMISTDGSTVVEYYSKDTAGNIEGTKSYTVQIDRQAPSSISGVSSRTVTLTASDANSGVSAISYRIGSSGTWTKYSSPFVAGQPGENVVVYYYAVDNAGNTETTRSVQVGTADSTAPSTSVGLTGTLGKNNWYVSGVTVKLTSTDNVGVKSTFYRWQGSSSWYTYSGTITTYTEGDRVLEYYSVDSVGNIEATKSTHVKIDRSSPSTTITVSGSTVTLKASDLRSGVSSIQYRVDGGTWRSYTGPFTVTVTSLARTVEYRATDVAGNLETTKTKSIAPSVQLSSTSLGESPDWSGSLTLFDLPVIMDHNGEWGDLGASSWLMTNGAILALGGALISLRYRKGCDDHGKDIIEGDEGGP
jgi:C1A family cysteine protease